MTRAARFAFYTLFLFVVYLLVWFSVLPIPFLDASSIEKIVPVIPWWCLVSFGSYSLWSLGWGLWTFRDCPEAYEELLLEISQAKNDLRAKGVTVD